ncbi:MAG: hypothetical protein H6R18_2035, partial [Proteobacteria bacterium]|nr:hypothetical protein [Pseudomonadota bacterium]
LPADRSPPLQEALNALSTELLRGGHSRADLAVINVNDLPTLSKAPPKLIIALGSSAAQALAESAGKTPILFAMLPKQTFDNISATGKALPPVSALYLDQPMQRQLALLRLALPQSQRIAMLLGSASRPTEPRWRNAAMEGGFQLAVTYVGQEEMLHDSLQKVLTGADVLLAVADPQVFNANTIQNILLTSFRARVPLLAFSPAYVKAGALLAVYSTPAQIGTQAGAIARDFLLRKNLPPPQHAADFTVSVNLPVANALGLTLDENTLSLRLRQIEKTP